MIPTHEDNSVNSAGNCEDESVGFTLEALTSAIADENRHDEMDLGEDVGSEIIE